jgi:hypothetical protein
VLTIYPGDCADLLGSVQPNLVLCDPPYREAVHKNSSTQAKSGPKDGFIHRDLGFKSLDYGLRRTIARYALACTGWSLIYSDVESTNVWRHTLEAHGLDYVRTMPWVRWSMPQKTGDRPGTGWEALTVYAPKGKKTWYGSSNILELNGDPLLLEDMAPDDPDFALRHKCLRGEVKHPTEKPLDQALDLVSWFSRPGQLVFDACAGGGTTGLACRLLGRDFLGCEKDEANGWVMYASTRLEAPLSPRDQERVERYLTRALEEKPTQGETDLAKQRRMCRISDAQLVERTMKHAA